MKTDLKKLIITNLPYLLFVWLFGKVGEAWRLAAGADASQKMLHFMDSLAAAFANGLPSFYPFDLCIGVAGAALVRLAVYLKGKNAKKYRHGMEYGSARWGGLKDIAPYIDPVFENNILLTRTERLTMNGRPKDPKTARNKNVLVIGGSGSGKTRFFVKPNLMQMHSSYCITDPKGSLLIEVGQLLRRGGYRIKVLNTINFSKSMRYNPFAYLHSERDILKLVNTIIANTKGDGEKSAEDFWVKSERLFYTALIGYIWYEAPEDEKNFTTLLEMINASEAREDDAEFQSPVDEMFARLAEKEPEHFAVRQYQKFLLSAGKTRSSILISCGARLAPFDIREVRELMETDEMELDTLGDRKTALFLIMNDTDTTFNFILAMLQSQLINLLCDRADDVYGGRLPVHVRLILDEFANIGQIPNFDKLIATIRSREISASIILQSQSQLKSIYKDAADIISDNCDCTLFLSGRGKNAKEISDALGRETIDSYNTSENRGSQTSHGLNYQKLGKELVDIYADEGLTGTRMDKREDFNRMLSDCRKGRIDKILVKSVSRFARNTKDCLTSLRELTMLGVTVYFEKENIHSETLTTELMVSVSGALAQQESVSISQNQRISYHRRMERGEFITTKAPFGYRLKDGKNLEIVGDEAKLIRQIFSLYLSGVSTPEIAKALSETGVRTRDGRTSWNHVGINYILRNEKYIGDALCQKTLATDGFPFVKKRNEGEKDQYYVEATHPAIISTEAFERVRNLLAFRSQDLDGPYKSYPLTKKVICGHCGSTFVRKASPSGYVSWSCLKHTRDSADCPVGRIAESEIYAAFVRMYNKLKLHEGLILKPALGQLRDLNNALQRGNPAMLAVNRAIAEATEQSHNVTVLQSRGLLDAAACSVKLRDIEAKLTELRRERRRLLKNEDLEEVMETLRQTADMIHNGPERLEGFDESLFANLVEQITAESQTRIRFQLYGGIELTEQLREVGR